MLWFSLLTTYGRYRPRRLRPLSEIKKWPSVAIIVPACNEEKNIQATLTDLSHLDYPDFEIIAVNDRSTDATGVQIDNAAKQNSNIRPLHIETLPPNWLGKPHALYQGLQRTTADYVLFTDADIRFESETLKRAIYEMKFYQVDLLSISPEIQSKGFWSGVVFQTAWLLMSLTRKIWNINNQNHRHPLGVGAFNLVKRAVLSSEKILEDIKLELVEDLALAWQIRKRGYRHRFTLGTGHLSVKWYENWKGLIRGLEKNAFSGAGFSWLAISFICSSLLIMSFIPFLIFLAPTQWLVYVLFWLSLILYSKQASYFGQYWYVIGFPFAFWVIGFAFFNSAYKITRQKAVVWRDTTYPLELLKKNMSFRRF